MAQTNLNIRVDVDVKKQADELFARLGLTMSSAINIFLRKALVTQGLPFDVTANSNVTVTESKKAADQ